MTAELSLRPLSASEFVAVRARFVKDWAKDIAIVDAIDDESARKQSQQRTDKELPLGVATANQHLYAICLGEAKVGALWFSIDGERAFLDDITLDANARGRGLGQRALELMEVELEARGVTLIRLNVYAHNPRAQALYERLGYRKTGVSMTKRIAARAAPEPAQGLRQIDELSTDQIGTLLQWYADLWWIRDRGRRDVEIMLVHSLVVAFEDDAGELVAFARVISDRVYKALVLDVVVAESLRGQGLGRRLMDAVLGHPALTECRQFELYCAADMAPLYEKYGFSKELGTLTFMRANRAPTSTPP